MRGGLRTQQNISVEAEGHQGIPVVQRHIRYRTDLDTRYHHAVAHGQTARFGKQCLVAHGARQRQQPLRLQAHGDDEYHQDDPDETRLYQVGTAVFKHRVLRTSRLLA